MDFAQLVLVAVSVLMLALLVSTFARTVGQRRSADERVVRDPFTDDGQWLSVEGVAELLGTEPERIVELVDRDAIPYFVSARGGSLTPRTLWFRRDEIEAWTIG